MFSIYVVQRSRISERMVDFIFPDSIKRENLYNSSEQVREVKIIEDELEAVAEERILIWKRLYPLSKEADRGLEKYYAIAHEREKTITLLIQWGAPSGLVLVSKAELDKQLMHVNESFHQLIDLEKEIGTFNDQLIEGANGVIQQIERRMELTIRWWSLKEELLEAEGTLILTLWEFFKRSRRSAWIRQYEGSYRHSVDSVTKWLKKPFNFELIMEKQRALIQPLTKIQEVRCSDGIYILSWSSVPHPPPILNLSQEDINTLKEL